MKMLSKVLLTTTFMILLGHTTYAGRGISAASITACRAGKSFDKILIDPPEIPQPAYVVCPNRIMNVVVSNTLDSIFIIFLLV
jgi:hypothetical protein